MITIYNRYTSGVLYVSESAHLLRGAVEEATARKVDLSCAYLQGALLCGAQMQYVRLAGADLRGASLAGADLYGACLMEAMLVDSDLCGAKLAHANLIRANFRGAHMKRRSTVLNWNFKGLIAEVLWGEAHGNEQRMMLAAYISRRTELSWRQLEEWGHPEKEWAMDTLAQWVISGDHAPDCIRRRREKGCV